MVQLVLEIDTEVDKARGAGSLLQYFTTRTEMAPLLREDGLVLAAIGRFALVGGRWKKSDGLRSTSPLKMLKARMRPARRRLRSSEKRLSWRSLSHMARDEELSLAVLQGVGPSPVGLYQPSVLGRWLPLHTLYVAALRHSRAGFTLFWIVHRRVFGP